MFKKRNKKKETSTTNKPIIRQPSLREIEELFVSDDYPLKGRKPNEKI